MLNEKEIYFTQCVKSGNRIYYIDVKRNCKGKSYVVLTESKRTVDSDSRNNPRYEKYKIFLYPKDIQAFISSISEAEKYIESVENDIK